MCNNALASNAILQHARPTALCNFARMDDQISEVRRYIADLTTKTGLSYSALANLAGVSATTVTRFMNNKSVAHVLSTATLSKLRSAAARHLAERQAPVKSSEPGPVTVSELPSALLEPNVRAAPGVSIPNRSEMPRDLPVYGTAAGAGEAGAFIINFGDVVDRVRRPPGIANNALAYGLYFEGVSMEPAIRHGDLGVADPTKKIRSGDRIVVLAHTEDSADSPLEALVKEFVREANGNLILRQFNPEKLLTIPSNRVVLKHRLLSMAELMGV